MHRVVVICYDVLGQTIGFIFKEKESKKKAGSSQAIRSLYREEWEGGKFSVAWCQPIGLMQMVRREEKCGNESSFEERRSVREEILTSATARHKSISSSSSFCVALQLFYGVLAFSTNSFYLLLSRARVFQFGTFNFCISFLTSFTQRVFGLSIGLLDMGFQEYIAFTILVPCVLSM
jgi:hypothetical protein